MQIDLSLHQRQGQALLTPANEILYGGAAGGGKSHLARVASIIWCSDVPGIQGYFFRRKYDQLIKNHMEGPTGFRALLAPWVTAKLCEIVELEIRFKWGSRIFLNHAQHEKDIYNHLGPEFHFLFIEEATQFSAKMLRFLRSRLRIPDTLKIPDKYLGVFPRAIYTSNPGGVGHDYLKTGFIDPHPPLTLFDAPENDGGMKRVFIPAKLADNPSLNGLEYSRQLKGLGSPELVDAMLNGDWSIIAGAFFKEFSENRHVLPVFALPKHWTRFRAFDWGYARPFSCGWYTVSDGACITCYGTGCRNKNCVTYPRGAIIKYREWYGRSEPNVGLRLQDPEIARGIVERTGDEDIAYTVADPSMFKSDGGPCPAETFRRHGVSMRAADNTRVAGWQQIRTRLNGEEGRPMLYFFETCRDTIRTLPALQHDEHRLEDIDTDMEDHAADQLRYGCMSRPWENDLVVEQPPKSISQITFKELMESSRDRNTTREEKY